MTQAIKENKTVDEVFYEPVRKALSIASGKRECEGLTDEDFLLAGIGRCMDGQQSGRAWVQKMQAMAIILSVTLGRFFDGLKSRRRLNLLNEIALSVSTRLDHETLPEDDPFASHPEMLKFAVYAADGHYHGASAHDSPVKDKSQAVGHLYAMNLRSGAMRHLDFIPIKTKKSEHEISTLKKLEANALRMNEPIGRKVILAYDPAIYNFQQWHNWKQSKGIYIITLAKKSTALTICDNNDFNRADPRNAGIVSDQSGETSTGHMLRRILYIDPASGTEYDFLTNEMTLPPGLIAFIYKKRWDIEKVFDEFKNKLNENKAWAKSPIAKCAQAQFMALVHNLMLLLERKVEREHGIYETKIDKARQKRIELDFEKIKASGRKENPLVTRAYRAVQRSLQFIRWLRNALDFQTSWHPAMATLAPLMKRYLQ